MAKRAVKKNLKLKVVQKKPRVLRPTHKTIVSSSGKQTILQTSDHRVVITVPKSGPAITHKKAPVKKGVAKKTTKKTGGDPKMPKRPIKRQPIKKPIKKPIGKRPATGAKTKQKKPLSPIQQRKLIESMPTKTLVQRKAKSQKLIAWMRQHSKPASGTPGKPAVQTYVGQRENIRFVPQGANVEITGHTPGKVRTNFQNQKSRTFIAQPDGSIRQVRRRKPKSP